MRAGLAARQAASSPWRLGICLALAAALHGALLFGVDLPLATPPAPTAVAITLVRGAETPAPPATATSPLPAAGLGERQTRAAEERAGLAAAAEPPHAAKEPAQAAPRPASPLPGLAANSPLALARAVAQAAGGAEAKAPPGVGDTAPLGVDFAYYLDAWRRKVERIGQLNYPAEARAEGLAGTLRVRVSIAADGALNDVRVVEGSGHAVLDAAALRIVRLAAPYAPFSPAMRAATEVLEIERTWQFRNSRLST